MDIQLILLFIMGLLLFSWLIRCAVLFATRTRKRIANDDFTFHVVCEKCQNPYDVSTKEFMQSYGARSIGVTRTKRNGAVLDNSPEYKKYAKKLFCPYCKKKHYAEVMNINEFNAGHKDVMLQEGLKCMARMIIGGAIILVLMQIPFGIEKRIRMKHVEKMRQEQMEQLLEDYNK